MSENFWSKIKCPQCQSDSGLQIIYGFPTTDLFLRAKQGELFLEGRPFGKNNRHCSDCGYDWADSRTKLIVTEF